MLVQTGFSFQGSLGFFFWDPFVSGFEKGGGGDVVRQVYQCDNSSRPHLLQNILFLLF